MCTNWFRSTRRLTSLALLLLVLTAGSALADNSKISPDLLPLLANPSSQVNVIVQYNSPPQTCSPGPLGLGGLVCTVVKIVGGVVKAVFTLINAVAATLTAQSVIDLSNQSNVAYISLDRPVASMLDLTRDAAGADYAFQSGYTGAGVGIAVIDSGIYAHPDLASRILYRQSFVPKTNDDDYGHGTHVAGIAAGSGASSTGPQFTRTFRGIAPGANLIDLRVLDAHGMSSDSVVVAAIEQAVALKARYNIRVINLSLGREVRESYNLDPICREVAAAWKQGIVVVVAAGNLGRNGNATILSPGNSPYAITVGAMKTEGTPSTNDDKIASYSSKGPTWIDLGVKPDIVAPGNMVDSLLAPGSTLLQEYPANVVPLSAYAHASSGTPEYLQLSGTSMATPVVSGAAAILLQREPGLSPDTVKARLMKTASKNFPLTSYAVDPTTGKVYTSTYDIFTVGAGYLNIPAALNNHDYTSGPSLSPSVIWNQFLNTAILMKASGSTWDNNLWSLNNVWGHQVVSSINGSSAAWGDSGAWASSAAWGDSGQWGTSAAWGDSGSSATSAAWGDSIGGRGEQ
jgi:serine protease AprX